MYAEKFHKVSCYNETVFYQWFLFITIYGILLSLIKNMVMERCPSGRRSLTRNQTYRKVPWVRIPPSLPVVISRLRVACAEPFLCAFLLSQLHYCYESQLIFFVETVIIKLRVNNVECLS